MPGLNNLCMKSHEGVSLPFYFQMRVDIWSQIQVTGSRRTLVQIRIITLALSGFQGTRNLARQLVPTYPSRSQNSHFLNGTKVQGQTALSWWKMDTCLVSEAPTCSISALMELSLHLRPFSGNWKKNKMQPSIGRDKDAEQGHGGRQFTFLNSTHCWTFDEFGRQRESVLWRKIERPLPSTSITG